MMPSTLGCNCLPRYRLSRQGLLALRPAQFPEGLLSLRSSGGTRTCTPALSMDAGLFGARLGLDDAYRFARGEEVMASSGQPAKLGTAARLAGDRGSLRRHGLHHDLAAGKPDIARLRAGQRWYEGLQQGGEASAAAALDLIGTFSQGQMDPEMIAEYSPGGKTYKSIRRRRALQRPRPLHHLHRLRMDLAGRRATTCTAT
jgi:hypothetical protein